MKPFKTYEEQLEIMRSRGLISPAKHIDPLIINILKTYGYYNIVNLYDKPFRTNEGYISNIEFSDLYSLHQIDARIKAFLYLSLYQSEQVLKTTIAYEFAKQYGPFDNTIISSNYIEPYLDINNFNQTITYIKNGKCRIAAESLIYRFKNILKDFKKYPPFIHYKKEHHHIPIWIFINKLSFGEVRKFYELCKIQNKIASNFELKPSELRTLLLPIHRIRNDCAHGENFFMQRYQIAPKATGPYLKPYMNEFGYTSPKDVGNLFFALCLFRPLLTSEFYLDLCVKIKDLFNYIEFGPAKSELKIYAMNALGASSTSDAIRKLNYITLI